MKLDVARLCLDCDEIHEDQICPACSSEAFAFSRAGSRPPGNTGSNGGAAPPVVQPAATHQARTPEQIEAFRQLIEGKPEKRPVAASSTKGVVGLAAVSLLGWAWRARRTPRSCADRAYREPEPAQPGTRTGNPDAPEPGTQPGTDATEPDYA